MDHAQYFPNKQKKIRRTNFTHKYTHTINSFEPQQQRSVSSVARRPRPRGRGAPRAPRPRRPPSTSGENLPSGGSGVSGFRTCWSRDSNFKAARARGAPPPPGRRRAGAVGSARARPGPGRRGGAPTPGSGRGARGSRGHGRARRTRRGRGAEGGARTEVVGGKGQRRRRAWGPRRAAPGRAGRHHRPLPAYLAFVMR